MAVHPPYKVLKMFNSVSLINDYRHSPNDSHTYAKMFTKIMDNTSTNYKDTADCLT